MKFFALLRMIIDRMIEIVFRAFLLARIKRRYGICLRKRLQPLLAHASFASVFFLFSSQKKRKKMLEGGADNIYYVII